MVRQGQQFIRGTYNNVLSREKEKLGAPAERRLFAQIVDSDLKDVPQLSDLHKEERNILSTRALCGVLLLLHKNL